MEDNSYLNYDILSEFMFEKMMIGHEDVNIKNVDNLPLGHGEIKN